MTKTFISLCRISSLQSFQARGTDVLLVMEQIQTKELPGKPLKSTKLDRNYNEDRVAIILNIMKPKHKEINESSWPKCSFFGVYDGHGGNVCADFLRDYLH
jgi:serine/threonine protein phosphatase PrpC